jgi:transposase
MTFFPFSSLHLEQLPVTEERITFLVRLTTESGRCPDCQVASSRVHSRYQRTLEDLPSSGLPVQVRLQVRRFFCDNPSCLRKTFAEAPSDLAVRYARKTVRLTDMLRQLGFALGGEQGARLATILGMSCSADTFLRMIRKTALRVHATPTHLGIDDWGATRSCMCSCKTSRKEDFTWGSALSALPG